MRLLYWDEQSAGHHRRYASAFADATPEGARVTWPRWMDEDVRTPRDANHSLERLVETAGAGQYDALVLGEATALLRRLAGTPLGNLPPIVALDLRAPHAWLHKRNRRIASGRDLAAGVGHLAAMEVLARRRHRVRTLYLNPTAAEVGTRAVGRQAGTYRDPLDMLPPRDFAPSPGRILLPGVQAPRKGLPLLASAIRHMSRRARDLHVVIAGPVAHGYQPTVDQSVAILRESGADVTLRAGWLSDDNLADELARAQVLALPYVRHIGGSGFIGTGLRASRASIVCPDVGLLGEMARDLGLTSFEHADVHSLAQALTSAMDEDPPRVSNTQLHRFYATEEFFGQQLWDECSLLVES